MNLGLARSRLDGGRGRVWFLVGLLFVACGAAAGCSLRNAPLLRNLGSWPVAAEQHGEQADAYREQAEEAHSLAAYHSAMAGKYRAAAAAGDLQSQEVNLKMARHCAALADAYKAAAAEYEALALGQESLAASVSTEP